MRCGYTQHIEEIRQLIVTGATLERAAYPSGENKRLAFRKSRIPGRATMDFWSGVRIK